MERVPSLHFIAKHLLLVDVRIRALGTRDRVCTLRYFPQLSRNNRDPHCRSMVQKQVEKSALLFG